MSKPRIELNNAFLSSVIFGSSVLDSIALVLDVIAVAEFVGICEGG
jgi:hypothetical protein